TQKKKLPTPPAQLPSNFPHPIPARRSLRRAPKSQHLAPTRAFQIAKNLFVQREPPDPSLIARISRDGSHLNLKRPLRYLRHIAPPLIIFLSPNSTFALAFGCRTLSVLKGCGIRSSKSHDI